MGQAFIVMERGLRRDGGLDASLFSYKLVTNRRAQHDSGRNFHIYWRVILPQFLLKKEGGVHVVIWILFFGIVWNLDFGICPVFRYWVFEF